MATEELKARKWLDKVQSRQKKLRQKWLDDADRVVKIYEAENCADYPFNILYSNTETILPSVYNSTPRPEVARRWTSPAEEDKKLDNAVASTVERALEYFADTNQAEYETYSEAVKNAVRSWLVPGLGQARVKFHKEGNYEVVCFDSVSYDRFVWGYARKWKHVPWIAFGHDLQKSEFESTYPEFCETKEYEDFNWEALEKDGETAEEGQEEKAKQGVLVWEIWDYGSRAVRHVCDRWDTFLLEEDYPEKLTSRFPCPKPLMFLQKFKDVIPVPSYKFYEKQAEELNLLSRRIIKVERALRVRGFYSGGNEDMQALFQQDDDTILYPTSEALMQDGVDKHIWIMPLDMLVSSLQALYQAREACKATIFEILGIGDILRGVSDPNETAKAQQIKNNWGGLRIKKGQRDVQDFCLELFRIGAEFSFSYCSPATFASVTKLPYLFEGDKSAIQGQMQQFQVQQMEAGQQAQAQGQPPPQMQPPVPPEMLRRASLPTWEQIIGVMRDSFERSYRIDIETNSTVDLESTEDKADIAEFMNAFGQMTAGFEKLLVGGQMPFEAFKQVMSEAFRRFRFGRRVQESLEMMQQPQPQPQVDPKEIEKQVTQQLEGKFKIEIAQKDLKHQEDKLGWMQEKVKLEGHITQLEVRGEQQKNSHLIEKNTLKQDYQGKMQLQQQQSQQKLQDRDTQLQEANVKGMMDQYASGAQQLQQQIKMLEQRMTEMAQMEQRDEEEELAAQQRHEQLLQALMQNQQQMADAIQQLLKAQRATRETQLLVGPDGSKRSVSRMLEE